MLAAQVRRRSLAAVGRRCLSSMPPLSANELRLLQQVSRLEERVHELEEQLPARVQVRFWLGACAPQPQPHAWRLRALQRRPLPARHLQPARITDWDNLGFGITPTNGHVRYTWSSKTSSWDAGRFISDPYVNLHVHAGVLHYGMTLFEGCKAFRCKDGKVRVCNLGANAERLRSGANRLVMAPVPSMLFVEAVHWAVRANAE